MLEIFSQVQRHNTLYSSLPEAFRKIVQTEGVKGLYRGFWINNLTIFSQLWYIGAYEMARNNLRSTSNQKVRSFIAGGFASVVGQTTVLPIDIVSQHLQVYNLHLAKQNLSEQALKNELAESNILKNAPLNNNNKTFSSLKNNKLHSHHMSARDQLNLTRTICRDLYRFAFFFSVFYS